MAEKHIHLAGVAGVGMSALAEALLAGGRRVSGSDRHRDAGRGPAVLRTLEAAGLRLTPQDGSALAPGTEAAESGTVHK